MKPIIIILFLLISGSVISQAQKSNISSSEVVWYGLDFSQAKLIGSLGFTNPDDIADRFLRKWNLLIKAESEKYDIAKFYNKRKVDYDLKVVQTRNEQVNADELVIDDDHQISREQVEAAVKEYTDDKNDAGLGLVFMVESFDKTQTKAFIWVTYFDIASHEVLLTKRIEGKAGGFGLRNFWARTIYEVMKKSKKELKRKK